MSRSSHDERVRTRAYHLWEEAGRPQGRESEFWHRAMELEQGAGNEDSPRGGAAAHPAPSLTEATASAEPDATAPLGRAPHTADASAADAVAPAKKAKEATAPAQPKATAKTAKEDGGKPAKGAKGRSRTGDAAPATAKPDDKKGKAVKPKVKA